MTRIKRKEIRILQVTPWFPPDIGGIANYVWDLRKHMIFQGYTVSILTAKRLSEDSSYHSGDQNIEYMNCFYLPGWPYPTMKSLSFPFDAGVKLNSRIKNGNFDIIHVHGIHYPISWIAIYLAHKHRVRSVLSLHGTYPILNPNKETAAERWLYKHLFSRVFSLADAVIGPAESITNFARKHLTISSSTLFCTVEYGVDTDKFGKNLDKKTEYRRGFNIADGAVVILFAGRFERIKGVLEFCVAVKKIIEESHQNVEVLILGSGTLKDQIYSIVGNTHGIHIFEWQPKNKIHEFYIASDIMVVPSRSEGVPITILEGMNAGLHLVYSPVGGVPDILEGYPMKTPLNNITAGEIHDLLLNLVCSGINDQHRRTSLDYAQNFDWKNIRERITSVYDRLLI